MLERFKKIKNPMRKALIDLHLENMFQIEIEVVECGEKEDHSETGNKISGKAYDNLEKRTLTLKELNNQKEF